MAPSRRLDSVFGRQGGDLMRRTAFLVLGGWFLVFAALKPPGARAEKIVLKDGTVLEGKIITRTGAKIFFKNRKTGEMASIRESQVARVLRDAEPEPPPEPAPPAATRPAAKPTPADGRRLEVSHDLRQEEEARELPEGARDVRPGPSAARE
jgi:hypothetical protein